MRLQWLAALMLRAVVIAVLAGCTCSFVWAQSATTGALTGTVTDPNGAVVPDVTVTLINTGTGKTQTTMTNEGGLFGFSLLSPGTYEVDFSAQGFKTSQAVSVVVNVSEAPALNAKLEVGVSEDRVTCECQLSQTTTSSTGTLVDSKTVTAVPLTTRNFTQLLSMSSGSAAGVNNAGVLGAGTQRVNVNGNTASGTYTVDGAASANTVPNPDTISEFKIQTSQYDSGYGARVPSMNLITRSGGNAFHGDIWEFLRNDIFNANDFFLNANRQPRPNLKQNQFGATIGGPIKTDRLFFFGSYQGTRQVDGLDISSLATVFLPPLTDDRSEATIRAQFCPNSANPNDKRNTFAGGAQVGGGTAAGCSVQNINLVALKLLQMKLPNGSYMIPTPQTIITSANGSVGRSSYSLPSTYDEDQYLTNLDYVLSKKHSFAARFYYTPNNMLRYLGSSVSYSGAAPNVPGFPQDTHGIDVIASLGLTSVLTSNLVNEARITYTRATVNQEGPGILAASAGMTPADSFFPYLPEVDFTGALGSFKVGNYKNQQVHFPKTYSLADNLSWVHGRHSIRAGVFFLEYKEIFFDTGPAGGTLSFQNFTDFLMGMGAAQNGSPLGLSNIQSVAGNQGAGPDGESVYSNQTNSGAVFVGDDIKVNSRLTLNLGLRWEYTPPSYDTTGQRGNLWPSLLRLQPVPPASGTYIGVTVPSNYNPAQVNPYTGQPFGPPPPGVFVRPNKSLYENGAPVGTFAPRFGFAWQPGSKQGSLAVRGGYGWFYQLAPDRGQPPNTPSVDDQPFGQLFGLAGASNSASTLQQPFPTTTLGFALRSPTSRLTDRVFGPTFEVPRLQQWNLSAQYKLSPTLSIDLGYVGSYGDRLGIGYGANQPLLATPGHPVNCGLPNTAAGLGVSHAAFATLGVDSSGCVTTNTSANAYLRVPFVGETPTALLTSQFFGRSLYQGMQATLQKQVSNGLTFQVAYTLSKALSDTTVVNDQNTLTWARTGFDRTQRVTTNFNYDLPSHWAHGLAGTMLDGWSISGIVIVQSGLPMTLSDPKAGSVYGFAGASTITLCPGASYEDLVTSGSTESRLNHWINTSAVCNAPAVGSDGSSGYGNTAPSIINGPGQFNTDFSIGKMTVVGGLRENATLAFRAEFYNSLNHPQFSNPGTTFGTASFGAITQTSVAPRLIQFGLKYVF